jgi:hypothetical protein
MSRPSSANSQKFSRPAYLRLRDDALTIFATNGGRDSNLRFGTLDAKGRPEGGWNYRL